MKSSSFEQVIQAQFDCLTKKVIKSAAMKYNRDISRRLKHEVPFSEISDMILRFLSGKHLSALLTHGDEAAIQEILNFYDVYISKLSLRKLYDEYGNVYMVVDSELKGRIQAAVMDIIANFEIVVI